nr:phage/plasmid primase, P4 family [Sphingomonas sp. BT552]
MDLVVREHNPSYGATFTLPFNYNRDLASAPARFFEYLTSCWGHEPDFEHRMMALQEMFAVTLFKIAPRFQRAFLLFGRSGTGKTVLLNILRALLPPNAVAELKPTKWAERFAPTRLIGAAANICGELPENGTIGGDVFKEVVEGSPIETEFKGKDGFSFRPVCAHWFASNYLPISQDSSRGFIRRWLILDFNKPVRDEDKIENLAEIIVAEEREAIAAWALEGLHRVLDQRGYTKPACHDKRMGSMRRINNSVHAFLEDTRGYAPGVGEAPCRQVYDDYAFHMRDVGRGKPVSFERFVQMLEDLDFEVSRNPVGDFVVRGLTKVMGLANAARSA